MRSLLFVPGSSARMMAKAVSSGADVVIYDLEDAVHPQQKEGARALVAAALREPPRAGLKRYVRVNGLDTRWCANDLKGVLPAGPDGIVVPKVTGPQDLEALDALIGRWEIPARSGATGIIAVCTETPEATLSLAARSWKHRRLAGLLWGGEDLSATIGATANRDGDGRYTAPFALARSLCLLAAHAAGVAAIDAVFTDFRDSAALAREADAARRDGFTAKAAIHPAQVEIINARFTSTESERQWAQRVVAAFESSESGVAQLDGVMLDAPHLTQAHRILAR
jgi:citrate lyase subunit beta / citryl-CoA lyase